MKYLPLSILIAVCVIYAAPKDKPVATAKDVVAIYNYNAQHGKSNEHRSECIEKWGLYFRNNGKPYVIDVSTEPCKWKSVNGSSGTTLCLVYEDVRPTDRMCECDTGSAIECEWL